MKGGLRGVRRVRMEGGFTESITLLKWRWIQTETEKEMDGAADWFNRLC